MALNAAAAATPWERGRLDRARGPGQLLFGRMHEDCSIEARAFAPGGRIFCIASAGCTAMELSRSHSVVAVDINAAQAAYAARRISGGRPSAGAAERMMALGRAFAPLAGWRRPRIREFLDMDDPGEQIAFWRRHLDTRRFRVAMDLALSKAVLGIVYAPPFLEGLPRSFGRVMRARMERCFARHSNRGNPYARALLLGELPDAPPPPEAKAIRLVHADAAAFLEREPGGTFDGFALSNVFDACGADYRRRLSAAVHRSAAPGAVAVVRSFAEPRNPSQENAAAEDRSMLWGIVEVKPAARL
jgi:S-adenosylmethionine:diacylglycerol 3-amino-3-carboxypropyl transferase